MLVELRTPEAWCQIEGVQILDADGWRGPDGRPWEDPISLEEFRARLVTCTQRSLGNPQTDEGAPASGSTPLAAAVSPAAPSSQTGGGAGTPPADASSAGAANCMPAPSPPRRFRLIRLFDVSGVSGIGVVAEGVQFDDGAVALRWKGDHPSTVAWDSIAAVLAVHGHHGATELEWLDELEEGMTACRVCGCTDDAACFGGCFWVEPDLCCACRENGLAEVEGTAV